MLKPEDHLALFLQSVYGIHASGAGTQETSFYTALNNLLDGVGAALSPTVRAVMQLKNTGAGNPDGGLFTAEQFDKKTGEAKDLSFPARGVIEVKSPAEAIDTTLAGEQIAKYWARYKLVLMTNLRDWALIGERNGQRVTLERFSLAPDEAAFWALAANPNASNKFSFKPSEVSAAYESWVSVVDLAAQAPINGLMEKRGGALIDIDAKALQQRMTAYFDKAVNNEVLATISPALTTNAAGYDAVVARKKLQKNESFDA